MVSEGTPDGGVTIRQATVAVPPTGQIVASGGVIVDRHLPTPGNPSGRIGYVLSMVTASDRGRPLYEALGFKPIATGMHLELRT